MYEHLYGQASPCYDQVERNIFSRAGVDVNTACIMMCISCLMEAREFLKGIWSEPSQLAIVTLAFGMGMCFFHRSYNYVATLLTNNDHGEWQDKDKKCNADNQYCK